MFVKLLTHLMIDNIKVEVAKAEFVDLWAFLEIAVVLFQTWLKTGEPCLKKKKKKTEKNQNSTYSPPKNLILLL